MAKFGLMLLREGRWKSTRLIDPGYVATATSHQAGLSGSPCNGQICGEPSPTESYGLLFWTNADGGRPNTPRDAYEAAGQYTSFILVIPSLDLVVARAGPASAAWASPPGTDAKSTFYALVAGAVNGAPTTTRRAPEVLRGSIESLI